MACGVGGYVWGYASGTTAPEQSSPVADADRAPQATAQVAPRETGSVRSRLPRLTVEAARLWRADEPAPLTISCSDAGSNVSVLIDGLAPGSTLWAGIPASPNAWRLASKDLNFAVVWPPRGFVGVMNLTLELRLSDDTVADRKGLQLEWAGASALPPATSAEPSQRRLDASEIAMLMKRGTDLVVSGDIGAARMMFQPAAEAGEPTAAFALAETYDPVVLDKLGATGVAPDVALAQRWYEKAKALGSTAAPSRLVGLTR
jgi:hypothetical protein